MCGESVRFRPDQRIRIIVRPGRSRSRPPQRLSPDFAIVGSIGTSDGRRFVTGLNRPINPVDRGVPIVKTSTRGHCLLKRAEDQTKDGAKSPVKPTRSDRQAPVSAARSLPLPKGGRVAAAGRDQRRGKSLPPYQPARLWMLGQTRLPVRWAPALERTQVDVQDLPD